MQEAIDCGLLSDKEKIRPWCNRLADKSEMELIEGMRKLKDVTGPLNLGKLRELCVYVAPLSERIYRKDRQLEQKPSDEKTREYWKQKRKEESGI